MTGETPSEAWLVLSVAFENSRGERAVFLISHVLISQSVCYSHCFFSFFFYSVCVSCIASVIPLELILP